MHTVKDAEYVYLVCHNCGERQKLLKQRDDSWVEAAENSYIMEGLLGWSLKVFLVSHADCPQEAVELEYDNL